MLSEDASPNGFSITTIKRGISVNTIDGEDEGVEASSCQNVEVEGNFEIPPPHIEEVHEDTNTQIFQLQL